MGMGGAWYLSSGVGRKEKRKGDRLGVAGGIKGWEKEKEKKSFEPDSNQRPIDFYVPLQSTALPTELSKALERGCLSIALYMNLKIFVFQNPWETL